MLHAFLSQFIVLETLDIQNSGVYLEKYCPDELLNNLNTNSLRHLSIQQTSFDSYGICKEQCDLDKINANKSQHTTYLDLSHSQHVVVKGNFFIAFPNLKLIDLSYNELTVTPNPGRTPDHPGFALLFLLHPTIEIINLSNQNLQNNHLIKSQANIHHISKRSVDISISNFKENIQNLTEVGFGYKVPLQYIPNAAEMLGAPAECMIQIDDFDEFPVRIRFPLSPNLKRINIENFFPQRNFILGHNAFNICFSEQNMLHSLVVSRISSFDSISVDSLTGVFGLNQLYELSMSKMEFDINIDRISYFSTKIKTLDLSKNSFSFKDKFKVCDDLPNLESLGFIWFKSNWNSVYVFRGL